ncbi:MAG: SRPBCC domain-containing protein [Sphingobacteriales bacterium]
MAQSIKHQLFFPHPPAAVWEYLTDSELMKLWLMPNDFKPVVGHEFQFRTNPHPDVNFGGIFYCKVLEVAPFEKLSYSWKCGPEDGTTTIDSVVNWELQPKDNGTLLLLDHNNFAIMENLPLFNSMIDGWLRNMHKIAENLNKTNHDTTNA